MPHNHDGDEYHDIFQDSGAAEEDGEKMEQPEVTWKEMAAGTEVADHVLHLAEYLDKVSAGTAAIAQSIREDLPVDLTQLLYFQHKFEKTMELLSAALTITMSYRLHAKDHPIWEFLQHQNDRAKSAIERNGLTVEMVEDVTAALEKMGMSRSAIAQALRESMKGVQPSEDDEDEDDDGPDHPSTHDHVHH